jgi:hypothetical protein
VRCDWPGSCTLPGRVRLEGLRLQILRFAGGGAVLLAVTATPTTATIRIQQEALTLGYPAYNCSYCHTFDSDHMKQRGKSQGIEVRTLDCYACHKSRLPKTGERLLNERGVFLLAAKRHMRADKVMAEWLKTYKAPSPVPSSAPKPKPIPKS